MERVFSFLEDVRRRTSRLCGERKNLGENPMFSRDVQTLDSFRLGFMRPCLFATLCRKYGLDAQASEAILMQADRLSDPHVHSRGKGFFLPLGAQEGFEDCGGAYLGPCRPAEQRFELTFEAAQPGRFFTIEPGVIHFFTPGQGSLFSAIAFVSPRIQQPDGSFDILRFGSPSIRDDGKTAVVESL